jgi:DNA repair protein RecO (recombination protein O)
MAILSSQTMTAEKTTGLVIRLADFSESSHVVTWFTRDFGKLATIAKGGKRLKGPFETALDLLAESRLVFLRKSSGGLDILTECQLMARFRPPARNLNCLYGGYYVAELLAGLTEEYDPHPVLYDEAVATLRRLTEDGDFRWPVLRFEVVTLREIGQLPDFKACLACGRTVADHTSFVFWVSQGGLLCPNCRRSEFASHPIHGATLALFEQLAAIEPPAPPTAPFPSQTIQELRHLITAAICQPLDRRPKMLSYLPFT